MAEKVLASRELLLGVVALLGRATPYEDFFGFSHVRPKFGVVSPLISKWF